MNPLDRERLRRRRIAGRLTFLVLPIVLATAGLVAPAIERHRDARVRGEESMAEFDEQIRSIADLIEFKRTHASRLTESEATLNTLFARDELAVDYRSSIRSRLARTGAEIQEVEQVTFDGEPPEEELALPFSVTRVRVSATLPFSAIASFLDLAETDDRPVVIEHVELRRIPDRLDRVELRCGLAYLSRPKNESED